jgi:CRISP-associated protein Cas1
VEGTAARLYFGSFPLLLAERISLPGPGFTGIRNRRPPTDAVNAVLSFCYSLLTRETTNAVLTVGFDPYMGVLHRPRFGRPSLALDLAEEFRPLIADSVVLTVINKREVGAGDFIVRAGAVALNQTGRRSVLAAWERRMATEVHRPVFGYTLSYRRVIEIQARLLAATMLGEIDDYTAFVTR